MSEVLLPTTNVVFAKPFGKTTTRRLVALDGLGLEYTEQLVWSKWALGEEYVQVC